MTFFFQPANITSQILNFGLPAPIDLQVVGRNAEANYADRPEAGAANRAHSRRGRRACSPGGRPAGNPPGRGPRQGLADGLTQRDVTSSMLISLSGSGTVAPNFWMNWTNGVNYNVGVQTPQYRIDSLDALLRTPISAATNAVNSTTPGSMAGASTAGQRFGRRLSERLLAGLRKSRTPWRAARSCSRTWSRCNGRTCPVIVNHYNVWPVFDVYRQRGPAGPGRRGRGSR